MFGIYGREEDAGGNFAAKKLTMRIELPKAAEWDSAENYAENLRSAVIAGGAGCVPAGCPVTALADAGERTAVLPDGRILTVADDFRTIALDGSPAGELKADFRAAMADGDRLVIFTADGPEWVSDGLLQGAAPGSPAVEIGLAPLTTRLTAEVRPISPLKGTYPRMTGNLEAADREAMAVQVQAALNSVRSQARLRGMLVQPSWVAWQMKDADGRIVARGEPQMFGSLQGDSPLTFRATRSGSTFTVSGTSTFTVGAFGLTLKVGRSDSAFWRSRISRLEIIVWPDCARVSRTVGHLTEADSSTSTLTVTPVIEATERGADGIVAARIDMPLEGVEMNLSLSEIEACTWGDDDDSETTRRLVPSEVFSAGTLTAYALDGEVGVIAVAPSADPLRLTARSRICQGRILRICAPVGTAGGWNYARHHLLAFATDGIYAVSVDSTLTRLSAIRISGDGVSRRDAVTSSPEAVYVATARGALLKLKGTRTTPLATPLTPVALVWNGAFGGELLLLEAGGRLAAIDRNGRASLRTLFRAERLVEPAMAVDTLGALRRLDREEPTATEIVWHRRVADPGAAIERRVQWQLDSACADALRLRVLADGGGTPQRVLQLSVSGPVNAPVSARFRSPRRAYLTAEIRGSVKPPTRLVQLLITNS